nr:hypothetical protein [uncultured Anaerostipes sp.]
MKELKNYIYLDEVGIDELISQITSEKIKSSDTRIITTKTEDVEERIGLNIGRKMGIGGSVSKEGKTTIETNKNIDISYEGKIQ